MSCARDCVLMPRVICFAVEATIPKILEKLQRQVETDEDLL